MISIEPTASPRISVVLPVYNGERYLEACIRSVLAQDLDSYELLIADDASSDRSWQIIQEFANPHVRSFRRNQNLGLFPNLNALLRESRAPLIHFFCQDDLMESHCLRWEIEFFKGHPEIGMSYCKARFIDENGIETGQTPIDDLPAICSPYVSLQYFLYLGCLPGNLSTACVRRSALVRVGVFDESFTVGADYDLWARISQGEPLGILHQFLIRMRRHAQQLSRARSSAVNSIGEDRRVRANILKQLPTYVHRRAEFYIRARQNVFDTHYALRCLFEHRFADSWQIVRTLGFVDATWGLLFWLLTANNHLYQPRPPFEFEV